VVVSSISRDERWCSQSVIDLGNGNAYRAVPVYRWEALLKISIFKDYRYKGNFRLIDLCSIRRCLRITARSCVSHRGRFPSYLWVIQFTIIDIKLISGFTDRCLKCSGRAALLPSSCVCAGVRMFGVLIYNYFIDR
jgi:hypothetical protein